MNTHEHPGGYGAYRSLEHHRGIKINEIEIPILPVSVDQVVDLYEKAITPRTRVIVVSHITYISGLLTPVKELSEMAHRRGLLISVDGAHPPGMMDLNFHDIGCDHYAAAGQKWLMAGTGTGLGFFKADIEARVRQLSTRFREGLLGIPGVKLQTPMDPRMSAGLTHFSTDFH